ncbi:Acyl-CoA N-acyltransferase [Cordyceps fumosorosea ARSEF 2679]|uniref:Acyl-CoA N-acyltransferase n=1 Tax=Cordyceps fumosorosea (strain ARSEF 2679) TaxID=1081104 RepID=A0A167PB22_CORFA|nr:Acyl-CoA N-acyltransferase [Cordyceps fumosorosea ARSEF 2679]OAA56478.1 Acyl-CoA N-acyltransferase [Cordyceps fumosorosea ARSEF 2679]
MTATLAAVQEWSAVDVQASEYVSENFPSGLLDWVLDDPEKHAGKCPDLTIEGVNGTGLSIFLAHWINIITIGVIHTLKTIDLTIKPTGDNANFKSNPSLEVPSADSIPAEDLTQNESKIGTPAQDPESVLPVDEAKERASGSTEKGEIQERAIQDDNTTPNAKDSLSSWSVSAIAEGHAAALPKEVSVGQDEEDKISCKMDSSPKVEPPFARPPWTPVHSWLMETVEIAMPHEITKAATSVDCLAIDPETGAFIPEIEQPECKLNHDFDLRSEPAWRRSNMTSGMQISRELRARARLGQRLKEMQPVPPVPEEAESSFPRAHCTIRPATDDDIGGILDIAKLERENNGLDENSGKLSVGIRSEDIAEHLQKCQEEQWPFIVATSEDELLDQSKWPAGSDTAYKAYVAYRGSIEPKAVIVGFAFALRRKSSGLDVYHDRVDQSCYITLFVHPGHRNKKYGSALLDRILMSVSPIHRSLIDFRWKCDDPAEVYEPLASKNAQQYARAFVEYEARMEGQASPAKKLLEKFGFSQVGHLSCVRNQNGEGKKLWWDRFTWEFAAQSLENVRG